MTEPDETVGETLRYFGDIWKLEIDCPRHRINDKVFNDGMPSSWRAGLYRKCYTCGGVGKNFFRCQGTCGGKYIYCSIKCQKLAWREHCDVHGCRKIVAKGAVP